MAEAKTAVANRPAWVELSSTDPAGSREFYSKLFGWTIDVSPDPQYGGYGMAKIEGEDVAGIAPQQMPGGPSAWMVYIGAENAEEMAKRVQAAGGTVVAPPFAVGDQGTMAVFQDPSGAFISAWQANQMRNWRSGGPNTFGWAELNSRGLDQARPFYSQVFGWTGKQLPMGDDGTMYTEFELDGKRVAGGMEMMAMVPAEVPSYWGVYFNVEDLDGATRTAIDAGARQLQEPIDFTGGRFSILMDPQGAAFGLLKLKAGF